MRMLFAAALLLAPAMASAQAQDKPVTADAAQGQAPQRIRSVTLGAGEKCPPAVGNEIVVCSTIEEPYRIPQALRQTAPSAENRSWVSRSEAVDDVGRRAGGLPNTCSATGSGGQTGCTQALLQQWSAEQRAKRNGTPDQ